MHPKAIVVVAVIVPTSVAIVVPQVADGEANVARVPQLACLGVADQDTLSCEQQLRVNGIELRVNGIELHIIARARIAHGRAPPGQWRRGRCWCC